MGEARGTFSPPTLGVVVVLTSVKSWRIVQRETFETGENKRFRRIYEIVRRAR